MFNVLWIYLVLFVLPVEGHTGALDACLVPTAWTFLTKAGSGFLSATATAAATTERSCGWKPMAKPRRACTQIDLGDGILLWHLSAGLDATSLQNMYRAIVVDAA